PAPLRLLPLAALLDPPDFRAPPPDDFRARAPPDRRPVSDPASSPSIPARPAAESPMSDSPAPPVSSSSGIPIPLSKSSCMSAFQSGERTGPRPATKCVRALSFMYAPTSRQAQTRRTPEPASQRDAE